MYIKSEKQLCSRTLNPEKTDEDDNTSGIVQQKRRHRKQMGKEVVSHGNISSWELYWLWQLGPAKNKRVAAIRRLYRYPFLPTASGKLGKTGTEKQTFKYETGT